MPAHPGPRVTLIDACVVINLFAMRRPEAILGVVPTEVAIVELVQTEAHFVLRGGPGEDAGEREPVQIAPLVDAGVVRVVQPSEVELDAFVDLTLVLDDGEAMTAAVALSRGWTVVTDDRKAERIIAGRVPVRSTLDLVKAWADRESLDQATLRTVLDDLQERGRYVPCRGHSLRGWWEEVMGAR